MANKKVLYVEDEVFLGKIVRESLESRGYEVIMETDGENVLDLFKEMQPDIAVLDIMLPNKDGYTIAKEIRNINANVPIIFLTAKTQTEDVVAGFKTGGNDYIRKPFSMEELIVRIENLLSTAQKTAKNTEDIEEENADILHIGSFQFQMGRQLLVHHSEEKKLSYREAELLKLLYQSRNDIIDRRDILMALWGNDSFFNSRNLDVYITKLRGYLKADPSLEILTIKGIGYRFVTE